jgi:hypothetical protein
MWNFVFHRAQVICTLELDDNDSKPIKPFLKGKGLLPSVGLARLDSIEYCYLDGTEQEEQ